MKCTAKTQAGQQQRRRDENDRQIAIHEKRIELPLRKRLRLSLATRHEGSLRTGDDRPRSRALLDTITQAEAKVILSGYANPLYDRYLSSWCRTDFNIASHVSGNATKRRMTVCVWTNLEPVSAAE